MMIIITSASNTLLTYSLNMSLSSNQYLTNHYRKKNFKKWTKYKWSKSAKTNSEQRHDFYTQFHVVSHIHILNSQTEKEVGW